MKHRLPLPQLALGLWLAVASQGGTAADDPSGGAPPPTLVTPAVLGAKITETEADPDLQAEAKTKLVALYREAVSNLNAIDANTSRAAAFEQTTRTALEEAKRIRERTAAAKGAEGPGTLDANQGMPREQIELQLKKAEADLAAANARRSDLGRQLAYHQNRPAAISQRLAAGQEQQETIAAALQAELAGDEGLSLIQARRWAMETRYLALSTEIKALDQELVSLPMRLELLAAKQDEEAANAVRLGKQAEALKALVNANREAEAHEAKTAAAAMLQATAGSDPVLIRLAEQNAELTDELNAIASRLDTLDEEQAQAERLSARINADYQREQAAREISGLTPGLGQLLLEHRAALPDFKVYARKAETLKGQIAAVNLSRLRHLDDAARVADLDRAVVELAAKLPAGQAPEVRAKLRALVEQRQSLLSKQLEAEGYYLARLHRLQAAVGQMLAAAHTYDDFLKGNLFWLSTGAETHLEDFATLPRQVRLLFSSGRWSELGRAFGKQVATSPVFWLSLFLSAALAWKRRALIASIQGTSAQVGKPASDRLAYSLHALILSLVTAAPLPLFLGATGWHLQAAGQGTELSHAVGLTLTHTAWVLWGILALRAICLPSGLAIAHFRWPEPGVRQLGAELGWLIWVSVPAQVVAHLAIALNPAASGGVVTRLGLLVATLGLAIFLYRVFHPKRGTLAHRPLRPDATLVMRTQPIWFPILVAFPLVLLALVLGGYVYSAVIVARAFLSTLWLAAALVLLRALALRWLTLARWRLARRAALERQRAALAAREATEANQAEAVALSEYADVDLDALTQDSRELVKVAISVLALLGLYLIWAEVLPALDILDQVTLWHSTDTIGGEERPLPITLASLGLALIYLTAMVVLAKRLPAVLDMILLERFQQAPSSRYTVTTLTTYAIVAAGTLLALNTLGAQWSQLQWLVAALGVGIGFGLQEIVANFVSGVIILFERPVRVGDTVTVGDTDGVVTKIRIRATTIRNLDRKELLVPNKEFITGRLLNWSLSDQVIRVMVTVGVAYGSDVEKAHALMREAAAEHEHVLKSPKPILTFEGFGDNSLTLILRVFIDDLDHRLATITDLYKAINRKFEQAGIVIAFPQRDLHLDTREALRVTIEDARQVSPLDPESRQGAPLADPLVTSVPPKAAP
jgi:potassium efflux system protein